MAKNLILKVGQKGAKKTRSALNSVGGAIGSIGVKASIATTGLSALSTKLAGDFQKSLFEVSTLTNDFSDVALKKMSRELMSVASSSGLALSSVSKAKYDIVSAGFGGAAESAAVLSASAELAVGGVTSAAEAADILTTSLNAMGLDASEVNNVSNDLFTTVKLGKTTMSELASSMGQVLPFAKTMGMDLKGVGASLATLTASGISTAQATTSLRSAMVSLQSPTSASKALMTNLGIEIKRFDDGTVDLVGTIGQFKGLDPAVMRKLIPRVEGVLAIQTMANNFTTLKKNVDKFSDTSGAANTAFERMSSAFNTQMSKLKNNIQNVMMTIGDSIIGEVGPSVKKANKLLSELGDIGWDVVGATISDHIGVVLSTLSIMATAAMNIADAHIKVLGLKLTKAIKGLIPGSNLFGTLDDMDAQIKILTESAAFATESNMETIKTAFGNTFTFIKEKAKESADAEIEEMTRANEEKAELRGLNTENIIEDMTKQAEAKASDLERETELLTVQDLVQQQAFNKIKERELELISLGVSKTEAEKQGTKLRMKFMSQEVGAKFSQASSFLSLAKQASAQNKSAAQRTKMLAKGEAYVKSFEAANKTFAQFGGWPLGVIPAALALSIGLANVKAIDSQSFASGGIVQGQNTGQGDTVPAMLTPGELILNQAQQNNLAGNMGGVTINFNGPVTNDEYVKDFIIPEIQRTISDNLA